MAPGRKTTLDELLDRKRRLLAQVADLEGKIERHSPAATVGEQADQAKSRPRPVRALVLDSLDDLGWPAFTRQLLLYCQSRYGRRIQSTRFGSLANDEMKARKSGKSPRSVWLCFGLTHDRAEPIKRLLARSDWPLETRIVAPTTGRVQYLKSTARLCELALEKEAADTDMMQILAADHARDLPGLQFQRGSFELERWRDVALGQLKKLEGRDAELRYEAAARWKQKLGETQLLFGAPEVIEGGAEHVHTRGVGQ